MTHEQLLSMWEQDAGIDKTRLDDEAVNIPNLHHKYLRILMDTKSKRIAFVHKLETLKKDKELYYSGQATADVYKANPFDLKLKTKGGIDKHVNTDPEVINMLQKIEYFDVLIQGVEHIMGQIQWRNSTIKSAIDFMKFTSGEL